MYRTIDDFEQDWAYETEATLKLLRNLTDASLDQRVSPSGRTAGRLAWHLAGSVPEMLTAAGLTGVEGPGEHADVPSSAAAIVEAYERAAAAAVPAVRAGWSDAVLGDEVPMYGQSWARGLVLSVMVRHQAHHRGQLTVLMRQAGLAVPGCYGPAAEEWAAMGMAAMA